MKRATSSATIGRRSANERLRDRFLIQLQPLPARSRAMFGGYGLYLEGVFFGVISDGRLYFRTDDDSRPAYLSRGMKPLQPRYRPRGPKTVDRNFEVPPEILADAAALHEWALAAVRTHRDRRRARSDK